MNWIRKIICLSVLLVPLKFYAEVLYNCVVLETIEGEIIEFSLSSNPYLTQKGDTIIMTNDEKRVEILLTDINKIFFSSTTNVVKKDSNAMKGRIELQQGYVYLSNYNPGEHVVIYNLSGQQIYKSTITSQGTLVIPFSVFPKGVAIIRADHQSFKINMR